MKHIDFKTNIYSDLQKISDHLDLIKSSEHISLLDFDVLKSGVRTLYENILSWEKENQTPYSTPAIEKNDLPFANEMEDNATETISSETTSEDIMITNQMLQEEPMDETIESHPEEEIIIPGYEDLQEEEIPEEIKDETPVIEIKTTEPITHSAISDKEHEILSASANIKEKNNNQLTIEIEAEKPPVEEPIINNTPQSVDSMVDQIKQISNFTSKKETKNATFENPLDIFSSLQTIADKYKSQNLSLNEKLSSSSTHTETIHMNQNHISDLRSSIGINEKFLFINELFKGNMKDYTDTIIELNEQTNLNDAMDLMDVKKNKYQWEEESIAYLTLKDFLIRRFSH